MLYTPTEMNQNQCWIMIKNITLHLISCIPITISLSQEIVFNFIATSNLSYAYLSKQKVVIWTGIAVFLDSHIIKTQKCLTTIQNDTVGNIILFIFNTNIYCLTQTSLFWNIQQSSLSQVTIVCCCFRITIYFHNVKWNSSVVCSQ